MVPRIETARLGDLAAVLNLLAASKLPEAGVREHFAHFLVARGEADLLGVVGLELRGNNALLRSLVVSSGARGKGLGLALSKAALNLARQRGASRVYLLTETAAKFFPRFGFRAIPRDHADPAIKESVEFQGACPQSAVCMVLDLAG